MHKLVFLFPFLGFVVSSAAAEEAAPPKVTFEDDIKPIFRSKCANCHNTDKKVAGLDLTNYTSMMQGGGSGSAVEAGDAGSSYLWMVVAHETEPYMPPNSPRMDDATLAKIREWIDLGAPENKGSKVVAKKTVNLTLTDIPTGRPEGPPPMPGKLPLDPVKVTASANAITALASSPWAPLVAIGGYNQVALYHSETQQMLGVLPFPEGVPNVLKFSRNGKVLMAGGGRGAYQGLCVLWDVTTGERIAEIGDETDSILAADLSPDMSRVAFGGPNRKVKVFDVATGEMLYEIVKHTEWVLACEFSPDGVLLATGDRNGGLHLWEAAGGQEYLVLNGHKTAINNVSWRPDSNMLASCDDEGKVRLWELNEGKTVKDWTAHGGGCKWVEFTREGNVVTCGIDKKAVLWDGGGTKKKDFPAMEDHALRVTYAAEGSRVIAGDWRGNVKMYSPEDGKEVGSLLANPPNLQTRIEQSLSFVSVQEQGRESAAKKAGEIEKQAKDAEASVEQAKAELKAMEQAKSAAEAAIKKAEAEMAEAQKRQAAAAGIVKELQIGLPLLQSAIDQLTRAKEKGDGGEIQKALTAAETAMSERMKRIEQQKTVERQAGEMIGAGTKSSEAAKKTASDASGKLEPLKKTIADREESLRKKREELSAAQKQLEEASKSLEAAKANAQRLKDSLATVGTADTAQAEAATAR